MFLRSSLFFGAVSTLVLLASCAHNPSSDVSEMGPKLPSASTRSLASSSADIAKAYLNLAATLK